MIKLGQRLKAAREKTGIKQGDVAKILGVNANTISRWERDEITPTAPYFLQMCELYHIQDTVSFFLRGRDTVWNLNGAGVKLIDQISRAVEASGLYNPVYNEQEVRILPLFLMPASAGTGQFLDSDEYEEFVADNSVPLSADFCIRISGDSMEPRIQDNQIVFVKRQPTLEHGDIGIFSLNGDALCKKFSRMGNDIELISFNDAYAPIPITEGCDLRVFGKVV